MIRAIVGRILLLILSSLWTFCSDTYVIRHVTLIDGTGKPPQADMRIQIEGNRIVSVERDTAQSAVVARMLVIDGRGKYLIPGLWDTHLHLTDIGEIAIPILPTYGITSVRDMGGDPGWLKHTQKQIETHNIVGPRVKFCGPMLEGKWEPKQPHDKVRTDHWVVRTPSDAQAAVTKLAAEGVDCIKMRSYADAPTYFALAAAARSAGLPLTSHAPWGIDPIEASNAGQRSFEHAFYPWPWKDLDSMKKQAIEDTFRKNGSLVVPTLIAWETFRFDTASIGAVVNDYAAKSDPRLKNVSQSLRDNWLSALADLQDMKPGTPGWNSAIDDLYNQVAEMHAHGVGMMAGTDTGSTMVYPGAALHQELKLLVTKCGFTPMDALLTATLIPAKFFHLENDLGTVAPGKLADLVLLEADPLADIGNLLFIAGVMLDGRWFDRADLNSLTTQTEANVAKTYREQLPGNKQ